METSSDQGKDESKRTDFYEDLKRELQRKERALVAGVQLNGTEVVLIQDRVYKMIDYTVKRHDWYVDQCHRLLQTGLALIATGGAIGAIFSKVENLSRVSECLAWGFAFLLFVTGLLLVVLYNSYLAGDHPYRKVVDINSWFFRYRFPEDLQPNLSRSAATAHRQVAHEADYIAKYFEKFVSEAKDSLNFLREDLEQVAILLVLQRYRAQQVKVMARWLFWGLMLSTVVFLLLMLSILFLRQVSVTGSGAATSSTASPTALQGTPSHSSPAPNQAPNQPSPMKQTSPPHSDAPSTH